MPLYFISIIEPTKAVILSISRICSNFFWNHTDGSHKVHWVRWEKNCRPYEGGGLGIRQFYDISKTFAIKLWWRGEKSLWAEFISSKYCGSKHPVEVTSSFKGSAIWKGMKVKEIAEPHIKWIVEGLINPFKDKWLDELIPHSDNLLLVKDLFFINNQINEDTIRGYLGQNVLTKMKDKDIRLLEEKDQAISDLTSNEIFFF